MSSSAPDPLTDALAAVRRTWAVLPVWTVLAGRCTCSARDCPSPVKHPIGHLAPHGVYDATIDPARVRAWWRACPAANLGIATGSDLGLAVLDVDPRHGGDESLADLQAMHGPFPRTVEAITGGGGRHLYFALGSPNPLRSRSRLRPGLDLKAEGGYVVAPPSRHVSGGHYRWEVSGHPDAARLAPMPGWLVALAGGRSDVPGRMRRHQPPLPASPEVRAEFVALLAAVGVRPRGGVAEMHCCPWHPDVHPSLSVHWEAALFHCFGCEVGGGVVALRHLVG